MCSLTSSLFSFPISVVMKTDGGEGLEQVDDKPDAEKKMTESLNGGPGSPSDGFGGKATDKEGAFGDFHAPGATLIAPWISEKCVLGYVSSVVEDCRWTLYHRPTVDLAVLIKLAILDEQGKIVCLKIGQHDQPKTALIDRLVNH
ncbi:hypothetical protein TSMEX_009281 [Taenia solium]|eukprot:TsM_000833300 transcript=TsM_000833300 gene=TsM_000833300